jgi:hypothetical protein
MVRIFGVVVLGALVGLSAGCSLDSLTFSATTKGKPEVLNGSPDMVRFTVEGVLQKCGLLYKSSRSSANTIKIATQTRSGDKFNLYLKQQKGEPGAEKTLLSIEWEKNVDERFWIEVLQLILTTQQQPQGAMGMVPGQQAAGWQQGVQPGQQTVGWQQGVQPGMPVQGQPQMNAFSNPQMANAAGQPAYPPQQNMYYQGGQGQPTYPGMRPGMGQ